jgi:glyoxylase-like metal-dependent hydrolase (beta-lactamase superfamily II)
VIPLRIWRHKEVIQLTFMPTLFPVSCYLVEEDDGITLVDAALPYSVKGILQTASSMGKPITRIVLTHAHGDHIGALDALAQQLPEAKLYISERDNRLLVGDRSLIDGEPVLPVRGGVPKPNQIRTQADVLLRDGDRVGSLQAIDAPGHTPGSMAFLDIRSGALLAGDAFHNRAGLTVSSHLRLRFPFPAMATWSKDLAVASAKRLLELQPTLLAVGHGPMLRNPAGAMERAITAAERDQSRQQKKGADSSHVTKNRS